MKEFLKLYESYIGFTHSFSARKQVFFLNPWQEERYWEQLEATFKRPLRGSGHRFLVELLSQCLDAYRLYRGN